MIRKILPYVLVVLFFWYLPDIVIFSKNLSNYIYKEATVRTTGRVEIKVTKRLPYLPIKYAVLGPPVTDVRVEMVDQTRNYSRSVLINEDGVALFENMPASTYDLRIGKDPQLDPGDIKDIEDTGGTIFNDDEVLKSTIKTVTIDGDVFLAPVLL